MNEQQITEYLMSDEYTMKYFRGVMAYDELPIINPPNGLYIVNTDISSGPGKHWVCIFLGDNCEYFDSLGNPPSELLYFIKKQGKVYVYSDKKLQGMSDVCGDYCILFSYFRCRGVSMKNFVEMFTNDTIYNDTLVEL